LTCEMQEKLVIVIATMGPVAFEELDAPAPVATNYVLHVWDVSVLRGLVLNDDSYPSPKIVSKQVFAPDRGPRASLGETAVGGDSMASERAIAILAMILREETPRRSMKQVLVLSASAVVVNEVLPSRTRSSLSVSLVAAISFL